MFAHAPIHTYGRVLKTRVSEAWRQTVLRGSPRVTDGSPPQGRMAAFVNHLYDDLARNLFTPAPYLRNFSADSAYYLFRICTQDQNIADEEAAWGYWRAKYRRMLSSLRRALALPEVLMCAQQWTEIDLSSVPSLAMARYKRAFIPTQDPRPKGVSQTQYGDRRCPLCPGRHLCSEAHLYLSCTVTLAHPLISEFRVRFPWDSYTQQQQMVLLLGTMPQDPVAQRHKQWFRTILSQCHALNTNHVDSAERSADVPSPDRDVGRSGASRSQCIQSDSNPSSPAGSVLDDYDL